MIYERSALAIAVFLGLLGIVLGISFRLGAKAKSASGFFAAHGEIPWFVNGIAFAGDYLSAASFLGICGLVAFYGYDGFLYSIGYLAGWIVALFVVAEPLKRMGKYTFADALDNRFHSKGIKLAAAISTLIVSLFYLIPQMVGAGNLILPLLGLPYEAGVVLVGAVVIAIVVTAGMVSTTWVQFIKGGMLVVFCGILTVMILNRGISTIPPDGQTPFAMATEEELAANGDLEKLPADGNWAERPYVRFRDKQSGLVKIWRKADGKGTLTETQYSTVSKDGKKLVGGIPQGRGEGMADFRPVGHVTHLAGDVDKTGPLGPLQFFQTLQESEVLLWSKDPKTVTDESGELTIYYQRRERGADLMMPGGSSSFSGVRKEAFLGKLNFLSLMLALFAGTASLPHILIRYYTVKDSAAARKSTVVGIAAIGLFYVLTLYLGFGAMVSGSLDPTSDNMPAPLLARSFGQLPFAIVSAIAFTTVLGTVSGLILAASGAVAHDLMTNFLGMEMNDADMVRAGKISAVLVGILAIVLGICFKGFNVAFLVGWAFSIAASANLPSLVMLLFWKPTNKQGIIASILVGLTSSLLWVLLSNEALDNLFKLKAGHMQFVPFSQPAIVTLPLGFLVLIVVSLLTQKSAVQSSKS